MSACIHRLPRPLVADGLRPKAAAAAATVAADFRTTAAKAMGVLKVRRMTASAPCTSLGENGFEFARETEIVFFLALLWPPCAARNLRRPYDGDML